MDDFEIFRFTRAQLLWWLKVAQQFEGTPPFLMMMIWQSLVAKNAHQSQTKKKKKGNIYRVPLRLHTKNKDIAAADVWSKVTTRAERQNCTRGGRVAGNLCGVSVAVNLKKESE